MPTDPSEPEPGETQPERLGGETPAPESPGPQESAELDELRERVKQLEAQPPAKRHHWWRSFSSAFLIVVSCVLALLAVVAVWIHDEVSNTDVYVATVAPLASNPDVQDAITSRVTTAVLAQIDVKGLVNQLTQTLAQKGVPPEATKLASGLAGPITSGLTDLVSTVVHNFVSSSAFATLWTNANRAVHSSLDKALTGQGGGAVQLNNNQVTIDLAPIIAQVKDRLVASGLTVAAKIPTVNTQFVVFQSNDIGKVKTYVRILQFLGNWLPAIAALVAAAGIYLARGRRRALVGTALGVAAAMLFLGIALTAFRSVYLDHLPPGANQAAAGAVFDALISFLRVALRAVFALALVTAIGAFLIGPSRPAVTIRTACRTGVASVRETTMSVGLRLGPVGPFVHRYKRWIGGVILAAAALTLILWDRPTTSVILWLALIVLIAFAIREFLDYPRQPPLAPPADEPPEPAGGEASSSSQA